MALKRKPLQGVLNIIRFNWHFYFVAVVVLTALLFYQYHLPVQIQPFAFWLALLASLTIIASLLVSFYIYDLYELKWIPDFKDKYILNINAGFDETSQIIKNKFPNSHVTISDFYNPKEHTEISIKRARKIYPPLPSTIQVLTEDLPFPDNSFDYSLAILTAHEIRDEKERIKFFKELRRITKSTGLILITEHLRDINNFLAYTIGFFHFHSKSTWHQTFEQANLIVKREIKSTPFITTFILEHNGDTP